MGARRLSLRVPGPLAGFAAGYDVGLERRRICRRAALYAVRDRLWQLCRLLVDNREYMLLERQLAPRTRADTQRTHSRYA